MAAVGEVALSGDVRPVPMSAERVGEALRLGYRRVLVPTGTRERLAGRVPAARLIEVGTLAEALIALQAPPPTTARAARAVSLRPVPDRPG
jgi:DNA repair protein RadA/Sms